MSTNSSTCIACKEWPCQRSGNAYGSGTKPTTIKLRVVVPGCQGKTKFNTVVHEHNLTMDSDNEGLEVGKGIPDLINAKEVPVHNSKEFISDMSFTKSDVVNSTVVCTVAVTTLKSNLENC